MSQSTISSAVNTCSPASQREHSTRSSSNALETPQLPNTTVTPTNDKQLLDVMLRHEIQIQFERLEQRQLLTTISGVVFHDTDGDSSLAAQEQTLAGWEVTLKSVEADWSTSVESDVEFRFIEVPAGTYRVSVDASDRWELTFADELVVEQATESIRLDLGVRHIEAIRGNIRSIDTNMDTYIDESDVLQAFKSGKYETNLPAKFEDGDWDGDGRFGTIDLVHFAEAYRYSRPIADAAINQLQPLSVGGEADVEFLYDGQTGNVTITPVGFEIMALQLRTSSTAVMDFRSPPHEGFLYEQYLPNRFLYLSFVHENGDNIHLPQFAAPGLSALTILEHLGIDGARVGGGELGNVVLRCVHCPNGPQTIVTVDASSVNASAIRGVTATVESADRSLTFREVGVDNARHWNRGTLQFAVPRDAESTVTLQAPPGFRLLEPDTAAITITPNVDRLDYELRLEQELVRVTEIQYHPAADGLAEFIEVANLGTRAVNVSGMTLSTGIEFTFPNSPNSVLQPGQHVVVAKDTEVFRNEYPDNSILVIGEFDGRLSNNRDYIALGGGGNTFQTLSYSDEWHDRSDGRGPSLVPITPENRQVEDETHWRISANEQGTPGLPAFTPGDANLDRAFTSADLIQIFAAAEYDDDEAGNSTWSEGDFDGDGDFTSRDIVLAFQSASYVSALGMASRPSSILVALATAFPASIIPERNERH